MKFCNICVSQMMHPLAFSTTTTMRLIFELGMFLSTASKQKHVDRGKTVLCFLII